MKIQTNLRQELKKLEIADQAPRNEYKEKYLKKYPTWEDARDAWIRDKKPSSPNDIFADKENQISAKELIYNNMSQIVNNPGLLGSAFILVQHMDSDVVFQQKFHEAMNQAKVSQNSEEWKLLSDRISVNTGTPQQYNTQDAAKVMKSVKEEASTHQRILKLANKTKNVKLLKIASRKEVKDFSKFRKNPVVSEDLFDAHIGLYEGYIKGLNSILDNLEDTSKDKVGYSYGEYSELKRRLAVPYNGVVLHELYFEHLLPGKQKTPTGELEKLINQRWNNLEGYIKDVKSTGVSAGNGWVVTVYDPVLKQLDNYLITDHDRGIPIGCKILVVLDTWEHAFTLDYKTDRESYIEKFLENLDYDIPLARLKEFLDKELK